MLANFTDDLIFDLHNEKQFMITKLKYTESVILILSTYKKNLFFSTSPNEYT